MLVDFSYVCDVFEGNDVENIENDLGMSKIKRLSLKRVFFKF